MSVIDKYWLYIAGHILEIQGSVQYWPERTFFMKRELFFEKRAPPPILNSFSKCQNKALHNFWKNGQLSIVERNLDLKYALWDPLLKPRSLYVDSLSKPRQSTSGIIGSCSEYFFNWNFLVGRYLFLVYRANYKKFLKIFRNILNKKSSN